MSEVAKELKLKSELCLGLQKECDQIRYDYETYKAQAPATIEVDQ